MRPGQRLYHWRVFRNRHGWVCGRHREHLHVIDDRIDIGCQCRCVGKSQHCRSRISYERIPIGIESIGCCTCIGEHVIDQSRITDQLQIDGLRAAHGACGGYGAKVEGQRVSLTDNGRNRLRGRLRRWACQYC